jgi:20S proteasome subunit beta 2
MQAAVEALSANQGGFCFDLTARNAQLTASLGGSQLPKFKKTGTTIVGVCFKDGVVLGADTRATEGPIVCDKNCEKIHYIADNIYCCGAGTAADTENVTGLISSQLELHRLNTGTQPRVNTALTRLKRHLFGYQGYVSAALVLGGVDCTGSYLYTVYPHGSTDRLPFVTMGSGSLAAMAIFESQYKDDMTRDEAVGLVEQAIESGVFNDLGSGSNVDVLVLTRDGAENLRNYRTPNERVYPRRNYSFPKGSTELAEDERDGSAMVDA